MRTIFHVSDLHFGKTDARVIEKLLDACTAAKPDIVVVSGDLTQRAHVSQFKDAQAFLESLKSAGLTYIVIPGNHDITPFYRPLGRAINPYARYREYISPDLEPRYVDDEVAIGTIDTVRREKIANGKVGKSQIETMQKWFATLDPALARILVTHHPLDLPASRVPTPLVGRAKRAMYGLESSRIDIFLAGHYHRSSVITTNLRYTKLASPSIAVQAGTVSLRERGEAESFNIITIDKGDIIIDTHLLDDATARFVGGGKRHFKRDNGIWRTAE